MNKYYWQKTKKFLLNLLFPSFCYGCNKEGSFLCEDCRALLEISSYQYCLCENPKRLETSYKCEKCLNKNLSGLYFALPYKNTLTKKLIHQFKYEPYVRGLSKTFASILLEHFILSNKNTNDVWQNSILVPIPLSKKKIKNRGYNQSEEIGKELSKAINIPLITNVLVKIKETQSQINLSGLERAENVKDSFAIKNPEEISGKKIFLLDDVYTTGSTMEECAKQLILSGAKEVFGITIAREG